MNSFQVSKKRKFPVRFIRAVMAGEGFLASVDHVVPYKLNLRPNVFIAYGAAVSASLGYNLTEIKLRHRC